MSDHVEPNGGEVKLRPINILREPEEAERRRQARRDRRNGPSRFGREFWAGINGPLTPEQTCTWSLYLARRGEAHAIDFAVLLKLLKKDSELYREVQRLKSAAEDDDPGPDLPHYTGTELRLPEPEFKKLAEEKNKKFESEMAAWQEKAGPEEPIFTQAEFDLPKAEFDKLAEERWTQYETERAVWEAKTNGTASTFQLKKQTFPNDPVDLWQERKAPALPRGLLPAIIEQFAFQQGKLMGADPAGLAMGALVVCAAAIPDSVRIQVKKHDSRWLESARLWVALGGPVSAKKSPIMRVVCDPLDEIDKRLSAEYGKEIMEYEAVGEEKGVEKPVRMRLRIEDSTPESVQSILEHNTQGVLLKRDE
jgi:Protein of unknown function (DUF3987)